MVVVPFRQVPRLAGRCRVLWWVWTVRKVRAVSFNEF